MAVREYTIETRLEVNRNKPLKDYLEAYLPEYNKIYRRMWHDMTDPAFKIKYPKEASYVSYICKTYGLLKRTVNSVSHDIKGTMKAYMELKKTERDNLKTKIRALKEKVEGMELTINTMKPQAAANLLTAGQLKTYRKLKKSLYYKKNRLNRMKQSLAGLEKQIDEKRYSICFGSKKMLKKQYNLEGNGYRTHEKWHNDFVKARDKNIFYLGSSDESNGNQMFQLSRTGVNTYTAKIRKENSYCDSENKKDNYLIVPGITFKHMSNELNQILASYTGEQALSPLTFRICRRGRKWYLQVMFRIEVREFGTTDQFGTVGLDFNDGFIELSETDFYGNLVAQKHFDLKYHGTGYKAETEMEQVVSQIVNYCKRRGKDLVIEDLDFKKTKAKTLPGKTTGKTYNRMLHAFDYSRYIKCLENCSHKKRVNLKKVNPYMTSMTGHQKYSYSKKLNTHQAASYVIARRGQGYIDKYKYSSKKTV